MELQTEEKLTCRRCGSRLVPQGRFCEECGEPVAPSEGHTCRACGTPMRPNARFCPQCGARASGAWADGLGTSWSHLQRQAREIDWSRVRRAGVPAAALLLVALAGYGIGRATVQPSVSQGRVVSATRSSREEVPPPGASSRKAGTAASGRTSGGGSEVAAGRTVTGSVSPPVRLRDFRIAASSYELANPPQKAADGDPYTAWHAWETERYPEGDWLTITFPSPRVVSRIGLIPESFGARAHADGHIRSILVKATGAPPQKLFFEDRPAVQVRDLPHPVRTRQLILRIATVLPGTQTRHIVVPEVQVWGYPTATHLAQGPGD